jgi:hypothetical protein
MANEYAVFKQSNGKYRFCGLTNLDNAFSYPGCVLEHISESKSYEVGESLVEVEPLVKEEVV